jgi:hypothetical protein
MVHVQCSCCASFWSHGRSGEASRWVSLSVNGTECSVSGTGVTGTGVLRWGFNWLYANMHRQETISVC